MLIKEIPNYPDYLISEKGVITHKQLGIKYGTTESNAGYIVSNKSRRSVEVEEM